MFDGAALGVLVATPAALVIAVGFFLQPTEGWGGEGSETPAVTLQTPDYVGSQSCSTCHADQVAAWRDSHHGWALRAADEVNILGDFEDSTFDHAGVRNRFFRRGGKSFVETEGPGAALVEYEIKYTVGIEPLQQYLVEIDRGRLQVLDVAWDTSAKRWFHLYPNAKTSPGDGLHWTGPYKSWQARCAVCHQTNFSKGYDPQNKTYQSEWSELTVGCEACHGPGGSHIAWAKTSVETGADSGNTGFGLAVTFSEGKDGARAEIELCGQCHSRRAPLNGDSAPASASFADHYNLALLRDGLYYADGQIDDEVYVLGSFLQSKMFARGVGCTNCHEPHTARLVAEGNDVCTQCHNSQGRAEFPTLPKATYDTSEHHKHQAGSEGAQCVSCHMTAKNYMIVDPRRDHSFRVPRPDLSIKIGSPNACTSCHTSETAEWAATTIETWYPRGRWRGPHYGEVLHAGQTRSDPETTKNLIALAADRGRPAIVRASAINLLATRLDEEVGQALTVHVEDSEPLVRNAAVAALKTAPSAIRGTLVAPRMNDASRSVRLAAARATIDIPLTGLTTEERRIVEQVRADLLSTLLSLADYPETQMQIGGLALTLRNLRAADAAFREAARMDPQQLDAWMSRARISLTQGNPQRASAILEQALGENPGSALLRQSRANVLIQFGALNAALEELNEAERLKPDEPSILVDIATIYTLRGENEKALESLKAALVKGADGPDVLDLLAVTNRRLGRFEEARGFARELARRFPQYKRRPEVEELLDRRRK